MQNMLGPPMIFTQLRQTAVKNTSENRASCDFYCNASPPVSAILFAGCFCGAFRVYRIANRHAREGN